MNCGQQALRLLCKSFTYIPRKYLISVGAELLSECSIARAGGVLPQPRPQGFSLKKWVGPEKALASAGHVYSLNISEKLIYLQPAGFALTEVERRNNGK